MYRDVFILVPSNSDYGRKRQSIKRNRKRPQSAKNRRTKSYTVSRLHQNFGSLRVSKIPFKEQTTRQNESKNKRNRNVGSKEKEFNGSIAKEDIGSWCPGKATVDHVKGYSTSKAVNMNTKQNKSSLSPTFFNNVSTPYYTSQQFSVKKKTPVSQGRIDGFNPNNLNGKTLRYTSSAFPLRRIKREYLHRKSSQHSRGSNFRDDADLGRVLRVGNCVPYVSRSIPAASMTRFRPRSALLPDLNWLLLRKLSKKEARV